MLKIFVNSFVKRQNHIKEKSFFFQSITAALEAGYHPSDCCKPMDMANNNYPEINELSALIRKDPQKKWTESELILCGYDPTSIKKMFKRQFGITFLEIARLRRNSAMPYPIK